MVYFKCVGALEHVGRVCMWRRGHVKLCVAVKKRGAGSKWTLHVIRKEKRYTGFKTAIVCSLTRWGLWEACFCTFWAHAHPLLGFTHVDQKKNLQSTATHRRRGFPPKTPFPNECVSLPLVLYSFVFDWCCFYHFLRNSLVALLEALFARW